MTPLVPNASLRSRIVCGIRTAPPAAIALTAWLLLLVYAFPGQLTPDGFDLLRQARSRTFGDASSPGFAALWHVAEWIVGGPFGMLLLQSGSLLGGLYLTSRSRLSPRASAWVAAAILIFPPVAMPMAVISPSSLVAGLAMLGLGGLLSIRRRPRILGLAAWAVATALRPGFLVAALPLILVLFEWRVASSPVRRYLIALGGWLVVSGAALGVHAALALGPSQVAPLPPCVADGTATAAPSEAQRLRDQPSPHRDRLDLMWRTLTGTEGVVVARHRCRDLTLAMGIHNRWSATQLAMTSAMLAIDEFTPLFAPWLYVLLALVLLWRIRSDKLSTALLVSGALHETSLLLLPNHDYSLSHWMVVSSVTVALLWLARRYDAGTEATEPPEASGDISSPASRSNLTSDARPTAGWAGAVSPGAILLTGWIGLMLYAYPGYMSYDSIRQLLEARAGVFSDAHPPAMAAMWRMSDWVVSGPMGMLVIQSVVFLIGANLLARRFVSKRTAALIAVFLLWFPSVSAILAVIWKDSQMCAFLMLGTGMLLSPRRGVRLLGLVALSTATAMRHNALTMTLPLVLLLFTWKPELRGWRRYSLAAVAWLGITFGARTVSTALTDNHVDLWHDALALIDIVGTLQYMEPTTDQELREMLAGVPIIPPDHLHDRAALEPGREYLSSVVAASDRFFKTPDSEAQRAAVGHAWKAIVLGHPKAFLLYRWNAATEILQLTGPRPNYPIYIWFTDISDPEGSAARAEHNGTVSPVQRWLQRRQRAANRSFITLVYVHLALALVLLPFCWRRRALLSLLLSGLAGEAAILLIFPASDTRYSAWLTITALTTLCVLIANRVSPRASAAAPS
jgi:hypothetical protein